jgi:hypothetical protein
MSLIEALTNVAVGYAVSIFVPIVLFPIFGLNFSIRQNLAICLFFTAVSIVRNYALRRLFEDLR